EERTPMPLAVFGTPAARAATLTPGGDPWWSLRGVPAKLRRPHEAVRPQWPPWRSSPLMPAPDQQLPARRPAGASRSMPEAMHSARLLIRAPRPGDGAVVNAAMREAWPDLVRWMDWAREAREPPPPSQTEADLLAGRARFLAGEDFRLLLFLRETGEF